MSQTSELCVFQRVWDNDEGILFKSDWHGVMVCVDAFPKLQHQVVTAPRDPYREGQSTFFDLSLQERTLLHAAADAICLKIATLRRDGQLPVQHIEGRGVPDHPHIVSFVGASKEGIRLYDGPTEASVIDQTQTALQFTNPERDLLLRQLDAIEAAKL